MFKKKKFGDDDQNPRFQAAFLMDKRKQADLIDDCWKAVDDATYAEWGDNPPRIGEDKMALRDGDDMDYDGYEGHMYVSARSDRRPKVFDRDRTPIVEEDGIIYSGCYVNAIVRFWPQNNKWGKRINASLEGVQFVRDGDAFTAPPLRDDAFDDLGEDRDGDRGGRDRGRDRGGDRDRGRDRDSDRGRGRGRDDDRGGSRDRGADRDRDRDRGRGRDRDDFADESPHGRDRDDRGGRDRGGRDNVTDLDDRRRDRDRNGDRNRGRDRDTPL